MQISMKGQYIFWGSKLLPITYSLAFEHSIPSWLVWAEIKFMIHFGLSEQLKPQVKQTDKGDNRR